MINKKILKAGAMVALAFLASCGESKKEAPEVINIIVIGSDTVLVDQNGVVIPKK